MNRQLLLCTDLDRTVLPNGPQSESQGARTLFAALAARPEVTLAYVTGRDRHLVEQAIANYSLPHPDYVISDVGTIFTATDYNPGTGSDKAFGCFKPDAGSTSGDDSYLVS